MGNKIFQITFGTGEKEWVASPTLIVALQVYCRHISFDLENFEEGDSIEELPDEKWATHKVVNTEYNPDDSDDVEEITFIQWMAENKTPDYICGTPYL